jgi:hypothetical protein
MALIFPKYSDKIIRLAVLVLGVGAAVTGAGVLVLSHPKVVEPGYMPKQPVPYSHKLHAGNLGLDCYYCHSTVEKSSFAAVPATQTCMNCHVRVKDKSVVLEPVRKSWETGEAVKWIKVHRLPDYVYFNHKAHVTVGVSCVSCHGRIDQMPEVKQVATLQMSWCLDCHRNPAPNVRPVELVTNLAWTPDRDPAEIGRELIEKKHINPPTNCSGCHR